MVRPQDGKTSLSISVRRATKRYGESRVLDDVSLEVGAGEFLTILGPSGSGKTTLLNVISGFTRLDDGSVHFGGDDVTWRPVNERGLGIVFQNYALFPHMTVGENVAFPLKVRRLGRAAIKERVASALRLVQLSGFVDRAIGSLSGGQRQRVALARAVVFAPPIVLMDEPLSALDKTLREQMQVEIRHLHSKIGATTIYVTHDQREALTMSDRIAVMNHGRVIQCDTPTAIYQAPRDAFVAGFVGEFTLLRARRKADRAAILDDGTELRVTSPLPNDKLWVVLRAERVLLPEECTPESNRIPITVRDVIYQGDSLLILGDLAGSRVSIRRPLRAESQFSRPSPGVRLTVGLALADTIVVADDPGAVLLNAQVVGK